MIARPEFARLLWKEYRQVRALLLVLLLAGACLQLYCIAFSDEAWLSQTTLASVMAVVFAAAVAATTFSGEHDSGTFLVQRSLPVRLPWVAGAKIAVAALGSLALLICFWGIILGGWFSELQRHPLDWSPAAQFGDGLVGIVEFLIWGFLFSLIERRPLVSLSKTVAVVLAIRWIGFWIDYLFVGHEAFNPFAWRSMVLRSAAAAVACWIAVRSAMPWFSDRQSGNTKTRFQISRTWWPVRRGIITGARPGNASRLVWLQLRVAAWPIVISIACGLAIPWLDPSQPGLGCILLAMAATAIGCFVFYAVHQRRQLLAACGVSAHRIWCTQLIVPTLACAVLISAGIWALSRMDFGNSFVDEFEHYLMVALWAAAGFAWGQLASLRCQSILIAFAYPIGFVILVLLFLGRASGDGTSIWPIALPLIAYPLLETAIRAKALFRASERRVGWWLARAGLFASVFAIGTAQHYYQIPGVTDEQFARALAFVRADPDYRVREAREVADKLIASRNELRQRLIPDRATPAELAEQEVVVDRQWVKRNWQQLATILEPDFSITLVCDTGLPFEPADNKRRSTLVEFLQTAWSMGLVEQDVDLYERIIRKYPAIRRYSHYAYDISWALMPGNDSARIRSLAQFLATFEESGGIERAKSLGYIAYHDWQANWLDVTRENANPTVFRRIAFWLCEGIRTRRIARYELHRVAALYSSIEESFVDVRAREPVPPPGMKQTETYRWYYVATERSYVQASVLRLALTSWQRDHGGELPDSLDQLRPMYLREIPVGLNSGRPYRLIAAPPDHPRIPTTHPFPSPYAYRDSSGKPLPFVWAPGGSFSRRDDSLDKLYALPDDEFVRAIWNETSWPRGIVIPLGPTEAPQ